MCSQPFVLSNRNRIVVLTFTVILSSSAHAANATTMTFDDRIGFDAAAGPDRTITFDQLPLGPVSACQPPQPFVPDPCDFSIDGLTFVGDESIGLQRPLLSIDSGLGDGSSKGLMSNALPTDVDEFYASVYGAVFGVDLMAGAPDQLVRVIVSYDDGTTDAFDVAAGPFVPTFFGAISSVDMNRVSFFALPNPQCRCMSNFVVDYITVAAVPEPASLPLVGVGLLMLTRFYRVAISRAAACSSSAARSSCR